MIEYFLSGILVGCLWLISYVYQVRGRVIDHFNLTFRRSRVIKVNLHTRSGPNIERFVVPDDRGFYEVAGGIYQFLKEVSIQNARYKIPEVTQAQGQISPSIPAIVEVTTIQNDKLTKETKEVPSWLLFWGSQTPAKINGKTAEEMRNFARSKIVNDAMTATSQTIATINSQKIFLIAICAGVAILILAQVLIYGKLDGVSVAKGP